LRNIKNNRFRKEVRGTSPLLINWAYADKPSEKGVK